MDDARNLQYGIGFDTADAEPLLITSVKRLKPSKKILGRLKLGRSRWVHLRFLPARWGRERPSASPELSVMLWWVWMIWLPVHPKAGNAAQKAAGHWNMTAEGLEWVEEAAQAAEAAAESFRDEMDDSGGAAGRFRAQIKKTSESAQDMGAAFKGAMADGLMPARALRSLFGLA
jgi:hypothetical protein